MYPPLMVELQLSDSSKIDTEPSLSYCWWEFGSPYVFVEFLCVSCALNTVLLVALSDNTFPVVWKQFSPHP